MVAGHFFGPTIRHEIRRLSRDGRFWTIPVVLSAVLVATFWAGWRDYAAINRENQASESADRARWLNQGIRQPHVAGDQGLLVYRRLSPLYAIEPGLTEHLGSTLWLDAENERLSTRKSAEYITSIHRLATLSVSQVVVAFVPLALVVLLFDTVARERQDGLWHQQLAAGATPRTLICGKCGAALASVALGLVPAFAATVAVCCTAVPSDARGDIGIRIMALACCYLLYCVAVSCVILIVSALARSSSQALMWCFLGWASAVLFAPVLAAEGAQLVVPAPHALEYQNAVLDAERTLPTVEERRVVVRRRLLSEHHVQALRDLPFDPIGIELLEEAKDETPVFRALVDHVYDAYAQQERWYGRLGLVMPTLAVQSISMALADTNVAAHRRFTDAAEAYREAFAHLLHLAVLNNPTYKTSPTFPGTDIIVTTAGPELWSQVPPFDYRPPGATVTLREHGIELGALALWLVAAVAGLAVCCSRKTL